MILGGEQQTKHNLRIEHYLLKKIVNRFIEPLRF